MTTALLGEIGNLLVDVHGQGEHLSLLHEREHVGLARSLRRAGAEQAAAFGELARQVRGVRRELESLRQDERERARRIDLLSYQVEEISGREAQAGRGGRTRRRAQAPGQCRAACPQLSERGQPAAVRLRRRPGRRARRLGSAEQALSRLARIDPTAAGLLEQLGEADRAAGRPGARGQPLPGSDRVQPAPTAAGRRAAAPDPHACSASTATRSTRSIVTASAPRPSWRRSATPSERIEELEGEETRLLAEMGRRGARTVRGTPRGRRTHGRAIEAELADLQMERARFAVDVRWTRRPRRCSRRRRVCYTKRSQPGRYAFDCHGLGHGRLPRFGQSRRAAAAAGQGGVGRRNLAPHAGAEDRARPRRRDADPDLRRDRPGHRRPGGRHGWAEAVGADRAQRGTADAAADVRHQVLCITHLPQLAAYGDMHYHVAKQIAAGRTTTEVRHLDDDTRVDRTGAHDGCGHGCRPGQRGRDDVRSRAPQGRQS